MGAAEFDGNSSTTFEREVFDGALNMTDGHARHELLPFEEGIVKNLPSLFDRAMHMSQTDAENFFKENFFTLARQSRPVTNIFFNFSASTSTLLVGKILRDLRYQVYAPYPAFDNLINLLRWIHVDLVPYAENPESLLSLCQTVKSPKTAIWIFLPNNPTGGILTESQFGTIVEIAAQRNITLVFDFCFRFFSRAVTSYDQYASLAATGTRYFAIEDTGKTWNTCDTKVSLVSCSHHFGNELFEAHDNLLLNISPLHLLYLGNILERSECAGLDAVIWDRFEEKRGILCGALEALPLVNASKNNSVPLLWLRESRPGAARHLLEKAHTVGIHILPGDQFFWHDNSLGHEFIRLPLARPTPLLNKVADTLRNLQI